MENWIDDLPICKQSGVGFQTNQRYKKGGGRWELHPFEDRSFYIKFPDSDCYLYGVFDGHDGCNVADFAAQRLPAELMLSDEPLRNLDNLEVKVALKQAFKNVDRAYFVSIDDPLIEKTNLRIQMPEGMTSFEAYQRYPSLVERLRELDREISGGSTGTVALVHNNNLYVANIGNSRAILCTKDSQGFLHHEQLSVSHDTQNQTELQRLANLGLDIESIQKAGKLGNQAITRSFGDFPVKGGYKDFEMLRNAASEPSIAEPSLYGLRPIDKSFYFLALVTDGLFKAYQEATQTDQVITDIIALVAAELQEQRTIEGVAQAVVDKICRAHQDEFVKSGGTICKTREDMTLLLRLFGVCVGKPASPPASSLGYVPHRTPSIFPVSIPFAPEDANDTGLPSLKIPTKVATQPQYPSNSDPIPQGGSPVRVPMTQTPKPASADCTSVRKDLEDHFPVVNDTLRESEKTASTIEANRRTASLLREAPSEPLTVPTGSEEKEPEKEGIPQLDDKPPPQNLSSQRRGPVDLGPDSILIRQGTDGKIDPYVDFTDFFESIEQEGGEAVVFADYMI